MKCDYKYGMNYGFNNETVIRQTFLSMGVRPTSNESGPKLWKVFISDVNPSENTEKYIDNTTVYDTMTMTDMNIPEKSGCNRFMNIEPNPIQEAANSPLEWSTSNIQRVSARKTKHMIFSLQPQVIKSNSQPVLNSLE